MIAIIQMCKENDVMTQNILKIWYLQDIKFYYIFKSFFISALLLLSILPPLVL